MDNFGFKLVRTAGTHFFIDSNSSSKGFWPLGSKSVLYKDFFKDDILACAET